MSSVWERFKAMFRRPKKRGKKQVVLLGLENQGRSRIMDALKKCLGAVGQPTMVPFSLGDMMILKDVCVMAWCGRLGTPSYLQKPCFGSLLRNTDVFWCCVDSTDRDKVVETGKDLSKLLGIFSCIPVEGFPVAILATKQDLVFSCMDVSEVEERMDLGPWRKIFNIKYFGVSGVTGEGLVDACDWSAKVAGCGKLGAKEVLERWLDVEDESDDEFLGRLFSCELKEWNHRIHLRFIWLCLKREGWQRGVKSIFNTIKDCTDDGADRICCGGNRSGTTNFHATRMHFWNRMVHFAVENMNDVAADFKSFLLLNPQLSNEGLFLYYYTEKLMFHSPEAHSSVVLPDKRPLPIVGCDVSEEHVTGEVNQLLSSLTMSQLTDEEIFEMHHNVSVEG